MDLQLLSDRLVATEEALTRLDARCDEFSGLIQECQTLLNSLNQNNPSDSLNALTERLMILEGERAKLEQEARIAEAEAVEAQAEAVQAEMEALTEQEPEINPEPEAELEVVEAEPLPEEESQGSTASRPSDLEDWVKGR